ncbi:MAG: T9SS type A sorting domain-containing protein [Saprospiraceae bacterium]
MKENILLNWSTASEVNNDYFQIEHSIDGVQFERIEQVDGVGNSVQINHYNITHKNPANGVNYYRLKQVDFDGLFAYSDIVSIGFRNENNEVAVFPNPFTETIFVKIPSSESSYPFNSERTIKIFDIYNRLVQSNRLPTNDETINLNLSRLSDGIYFINIDLGNGDFSTHRIIKQLP